MSPFVVHVSETCYSRHGHLIKKRENDITQTRITLISRLSLIFIMCMVFLNKKGWYGNI